MIRKFRLEDRERVMQIWLSANLQAHGFIDPVYWKDQEEMVGEMISIADVAVFECGGVIQGLIGLSGRQIEGLFVDEKSRSQGIGRALLDFAKRKYPALTLQVYEKNLRAVRFYQREGFSVREKQVDEQTGEAEYVMGWTKSDMGKTRGELGGKEEETNDC
jgi:putative acetyltransferase